MKPLRARGRIRIIQKKIDAVPSTDWAEARASLSVNDGAKERNCMLCTKCGFDNPSEARFCGKCGTAMTAVTPIDSLAAGSQPGNEDRYCHWSVFFFRSDLSWERFT